MTTLFALFAEVERDPISERTREGLAKASASGRKLGRPKGSLSVSRLDGKTRTSSLNFASLLGHSGVVGTLSCTARGILAEGSRRRGGGDARPGTWSIAIRTCTRLTAAEVTAHSGRTMLHGRKR